MFIHIISLINAMHQIYCDDATAYMNTTFSSFSLSTLLWHLGQGKIGLQIPLGHGSLRYYNEDNVGITVKNTNMGMQTW